MGFSWPDLEMGRITGVAPVRRCQKLPPFLMEPMPVAPRGIPWWVLQLRSTQHPHPILLLPPVHPNACIPKLFTEQGNRPLLGVKLPSGV